MSGAPVIFTERLLLGPATPAHADAFIAFCATEASHFLGGPAPREEAWEGVAIGAGQWTLRGHGPMWVSERQTGEPVGRTGIHHPLWREEPELGWVVYPAFRGRGYATEAARAARDWAWVARGLGPLCSLIDEANTASVAVAERLGARREGPHEGDQGQSVMRWRHPRLEARP